jgi:hypothetical protein
VLFARLDASPLNLIGPDMVRDLIGLVQHLEEHQDAVSVVVFDSASADFSTPTMSTDYVLCRRSRKRISQAMPNSLILR